MYCFLDESFKLIENTNFKVVIMHFVEPSKTRLGGVHFIMPKAMNGQDRAGCLYVRYSLMCTYKVQKNDFYGESGFYRVVLLEVNIESK